MAKDANNNLLDNLLNSKEFIGLESEVRSKALVCEKPVDLKTFLYDKDYLNLNITLSDLQFETLMNADDYSKGNKYTEGIIQCGKGGGKDLCIILIFARAVYKLLCIPNPLKEFGLAEFDTIDLLNVAISADQAKDVFFIRFKNLIRKAGYKAYRQFGFNPESDILQSKITFPKHIIAYSGHSKQESQEGKNYFLCVMDEVAGFLPHKAIMLYDVMRTSINTRFPGIGKLFLISYPRYKNDYIQRKYEEAVKFPNIFRIKAKTWEFNPLRKKEDFAADYEANPEKARAMYECEPELSGEAYFKDLEKLNAIFSNKEIENPIDEMGRYKSFFKRDPYKPKRYFAHVDLALGRIDEEGFRQGDVAALAIGHRESNDIIIDLQKIYEGEPGKEVQFEDIKNDILYIHNVLGVTLMKCSLDGWQSVGFRQQLQAAGISSELLSVDRNLEPYDSLKTAIMQGRVKTYPLKGKINNMPTNNVLLEELQGLILVDGKKVDHIEISSKDISDCVCSVVYHCELSERPVEGSFSWRSLRS